MSFHLLVEEISKRHDLFFTRPYLSEHFTIWVAAIETFIILILVWNDFFMVVSIYTWVPSLIDVVILFCLFASEVSMAKTIEDPIHWLISFCFLLFFSLAAFANTYTKSRKRSENEYMFKMNHNRMRYSMKLLGSLLIILVAIAAITGLHPIVYWVGISLTILTMILFIVNTIAHWNRVRDFIDSKKDLLSEPPANY